MVAFLLVENRTSTRRALKIGLAGVMIVLRQPERRSEGDRNKRPEQKGGGTIRMLLNGDTDASSSTPH